MGDNELNIIKEVVNKLCSIDNLKEYRKDNEEYSNAILTLVAYVRFLSENDANKYQEAKNELKKLEQKHPQLKTWINNMLAEYEIKRYSNSIMKCINKLMTFNKRDINNAGSFHLLNLYIRRLNEIAPGKIDEFKSYFENLFEKHPDFRQYIKVSFSSTQKSTMELENYIVNTVNESYNSVKNVVDDEKIKIMKERLGRCFSLLDQNKINFSSERYKELSIMIRNAVMYMDSTLEKLNEEANVWGYSR